MIVKIGNTLYAKRDYGRQAWEGSVVISDTKQSWLLEPTHSPTKVNKKTMLENLGQYGARRWYTEEDMREKDWRDRNVRKLVGVVEGQDTHVLRKIAEIVGYTEA